jgi:hypothetical protein
MSVNRFGTRITAAFGALLAALGFFLATYATSIDALIVTYGVIGGE